MDNLLFTALEIIATAVSLLNINCPNSWRGVLVLVGAKEVPSSLWKSVALGEDSEHITVDMPSPLALSSRHL